MPSLASLGMNRGRERGTQAPDTIFNLSQLGLDLIVNILKRAYPYAKDAMKYCEVNQQSATLCKYEEFWTLMCHEWKFGDPGSDKLGPWHRTKFNQTLGESADTLGWWKMWFRYCAQLVHDNHTLRQSVREIGDDGSVPHPKYGPIHTWDTSQVTNMDDLFYLSLIHI